MRKYRTKQQRMLIGRILSQLVTQISKDLKNHHRHHHPHRRPPPPHPLHRQRVLIAKDLNHVPHMSVVLNSSSMVYRLKIHQSVSFIHLSLLFIHLSLNFSAQVVQLPSLQSALQARRADFLATSQKRVEEIKSKDYTKLVPTQVSIPSRLKSSRPTTVSTSSITTIETDSEQRQKRERESKERSKRLYEQLAEVRQKKKFHETKQQAQAYRARMNAFQTTLDKKKTMNKKQ